MPQDLGQQPLATASPGRSAVGRKPERGVIGLSKGSGIGGSVTEARARAPELCPPPLPCPPKSNNSSELSAFPSSAGRTAYALAVNVADAVERWGIENSGFLTLTFADHVLDPKEAQRRLNSLATHVL